MTREEYLKELIKRKGMNIKEFSSLVKIPYSTVLSMLNNNIGGAAVDNVIKICKELGVNVESLQDSAIEFKNPQFLTEKEIEHIKKYRTLDEGGRQTVDAVLQIQYDIAVARQESTGLTAENERELEAYKQELLAAQKGQTSAALESTVKAASI